MRGILTKIIDPFAFHNDIPVCKLEDDGRSKGF